MRERMKNIVVLSDTHGRTSNVKTLSAVFAEADYVIHLGDGAADMKEIKSLHPEKTFVCRGNCDIFSSDSLSEGELEVEGVKFFFCHGDKYRVKSTLEGLADEAKKRGATVALFGHTHRAEIANRDGIFLVNPGSLKAPSNLGGTYAYISVADGKAYPVIVGERFV